MCGMVFVYFRLCHNNPFLCPLDKPFFTFRCSINVIVYEQFNLKKSIP